MYVKKGKKKRKTAKKRMEAVEEGRKEREKEMLLEWESVVRISAGVGALIRSRRGGNDTRILLKLFHFNNYETELNTAWTDCKLARFAILIAIGCRHK